MCNSLNFLLAPSQCTDSIALCYISFNHISILSYLFIFHMHVCICKYVLPLIPYTFSPFTLLYYYYYYYYYYRFSSIPFHSTPPPRHTHTHTQSPKNPCTNPIVPHSGRGCYKRQAEVIPLPPYPRERLAS
ncbi:hypothetical protein, conserved [Trypanosoma brucei brucei TREU927]|uniref:Uncharacterized protein n=1 Tax=Trypanosoma brucei brucei (strain 927/4 GUTat10.1) TaxID=185431 RepID=Q583G5_TRYB2|nr:hypothetical protein, conserved [Trypanosoma brucei brucei TREU927]AAX80490.1 hypothetical protein, conserved [Trypanosoma brucei]AAZ11070.1 hypothetical protein, conserved [Trypanosoma brucei brucei TREU927]